MIAQSSGKLPKVLGSDNAAHADSFLALSRPSRTKRNRKNRQAYNKRRKAKAAQQSGAGKPATTPAPTTVPEVKKNNP